MKNDKYKIFIILLSIIAIILIIILFFVINKKKNNYSNNLGNNNQVVQETIEGKNHYNYNEFKIANISESSLAKIYFNDFQNDLLNNTKRAFDNLDSQYKEKRFDSYEDFNDYIKKNADYYNSITATKYKIDKLSDGTEQYKFVDQYDNYYMFNVTAVMQYSVMMDTYTLDLPEFIDTYNKANAQEKVALNIQKFIQAINAKDYKYAYSKLDETFKNNNFKTQEEFENYIKQITFEYNDVKYSSFTSLSGIYTYKIQLTDKMAPKYDDEGKEITSHETKSLNIVMQLKEGTDFVMSFNVD